MERIILFSDKKIKSVKLDFKRYLFDKVRNISEKIVWISGVRWIWKTTMLLQIAQELEKKWKNVIYFSCDSTFFRWNKIFDVIEETYNVYEKKYFFIDEIHKYKNWEQDLKTAYDVYDDIQIFFSGSSSIDLIKWNYDLSRRSLLFKLHKFSFREYLKFVYDISLNTYTIDQILLKSPKISLDILSENKDILKYYHEYLESWELWFFRDTQEEFYIDKLQNILNKLIYEDISNYYNIQSKNIALFFQILKFITNSSPSNLNYLNIAKQISTTADTVKYYIEILQEIGLLNIIWKQWKISVNLRKSKKALIEINNIAVILFDKINTKKSKGFLRESFVVSELKKVWEIYYSEIADYVFINNGEKYILEIWWKNKTYKQLKWIKKGFLIKDNISVANKNEIPIWLLWFLY